MRKLFLIGLSLISLFVFFSCSVKFEEALENIKNPKIEFETTVKLPLVATEVNVGRMVLDALSGMGDIAREGTPIVLDFSTGVMIMSAQDISSITENLEGDFELDGLSIDIPNVEGFNENVEISIPSLSGISFAFPAIVPSGTYTISIPYASLTINTGVSNSALKSFVLDGDVVVSVVFPTFWSDVSVVSIEATILDGEGNTVFYGSSSENPATFTLSKLEFKTGSGVISVALDITVYSENTYYSPSEVSVEVSPDLSISGLKDVVVNFSKFVELPESVEKLIFSDGKVIISSSDASFTDVDGYIESETKITPISTSDGRLIANLEEQSLPATIVINSLSFDFPSTTCSFVGIEGTLIDVVIGTITIYEENLDVSGSWDFNIPEEASMVRKILLDSGKISLNYNSSLPVNINVMVESDDFSPPLIWEFTVEPGASIVEFDLSGRELAFDDLNLEIAYSASPQGYDGRRLTLNDIELGQNFGLDATFSYGDFSIASMTFYGYTYEQSDSLDLDELLGDMKDYLDLIDYTDISATLTSDVGGIFTLNATPHEIDSATTFTMTINLGENDLDKLIDFAKGLLRNSPERIDYDAIFDINEVQIGEDSEISIDLDAQVPLLLKLPEGEEVRILDLSTTVNLNLETGRLIDSATVLIDGTNTSGLNLRFEVYINGEKKGEITFDNTLSGYISIKGADIIALNTGLPVEIKVFASGVQTISSYGTLDIILKLEADIKTSFGGGEQ